MEDNDTSADAAALQAASAGYASKRAAMDGAPKPATPVEQPPTETTASTTPAATPPAQDDDTQPVLEAEPSDPAPTADKAISAQLEDLKAQVRELRSNGAERATIDRLNGQIGGITRVLNKLEKQLMPADNELAGALQTAEKVAQDYPELGMPMLNALKALAARVPDAKQPEEQAPPEQQPAAQPAAANDPYTAEENAAIKDLDTAHPDRFDLNKSAEFQAWLKVKGPDYTRMFQSTWSVATLSAGYAEFKLDRAAKAAARQKKQDRLEASQTPQGVAQSGPTVLPDAAGFSRGYARRKQAGRV